MALRRMHITVEMADGTTIEASGPYRTLADRVAFERRFGLSISAMGRGMNLQTGVIDPETFREEHHAFAAWCLLQREGATSLSFDEFVAQAMDLGIERLDEPGSLDPTEPLPLPPS